MKFSLPLKEMTTAEKVRVMEEIWADLSDASSGFAPPDWHREILEERQKGIRDGTQKFTDWETAKEEIRKRTA
jgi:hypothetical protein